ELNHGKFVIALSLLGTLGGGLLAPSAALAQGVKLSQIYGAGGNSQSPLFNDYIEIYNSGPNPQPLNGWSGQYGSATGVINQVTALPNVVLNPGQYLLVQESTGGTLQAGQTPGLPNPDATGTIAMSATDFKVALVSSVAPLATATPTYAANPTLVDVVGAGN